MILLDLSHTSHTRARTGIQRVARCLTRELEAKALALATTWDPYARHWRLLEQWERDNLQSSSPAKSRGAHWPLVAQLRGRWRRGLSRSAQPLALPDERLPRVLLTPELFSASVFKGLIQLREETGIPLVALFHDAIALRRPAFAPQKTVARFPSYLSELAAFDAVAAVSETSRQQLAEYWDWLGVKKRPELIALPLGVDAPCSPRPPHTGTAPQAKASGPRFLCLCTLEPRKNHLALLQACESLWALGLNFSLQLAGMARVPDSVLVLERINALIAAGRPLSYAGPLDEGALEQAYADCDYTLYPSLEEGYGLPVVESLIRGKPCLCSSKGALGERSLGGGCLTLGSLDSGNIAACLAQLMANPTLQRSLCEQASRRRFQSWSDYSDRLLAWLHQLQRH